MHIPVLLHTVLQFLDPKPGDFIIDGTVDGGGHASVILDRIAPGGTLLGLDWDEQLLAECKARLHDRSGAILLHGNYADLPEILRERGMGKADGLLVDLGFSSEQLESSGRGFSFLRAGENEPLLMTYDDSRVPVRDLLRGMKEEELATVIFEFGGERYSRRIAKAIKERGRKNPITTAGALADTIRDALPKGYEHGRIDPATRTFQALRIYANGEMENLARLLESIPEIVKPGGVAVIITFHSIEDGMVKRGFQKLVKSSQGILLTKKPVEASPEEIRENPRSRSAKVRAISMEPRIHF